MSEFTKNKTASFFVTLLIGLIIISFMFTGTQIMEQGTGNAIGKVGDLLIKPEEYQQEYNRQLEFYKQMMGGEISAKQIEQMGIKQSTLKNIIQRKLLIKLAGDIGVYPSVNEITGEIKSLPYFQTNGQFDLARYKSLLAANRLTTTEFESDVTNQIKMKNVQTLMQSYPLSKGYLAELQTVRDRKVNAEFVQINKSNLHNFVTVNKEDLAKFLGVETNVKRIQSMFNERKSSLDKLEEVKAKHILLMTQGKDEASVKAQIEKIAKETTPANFAKMADKYTEDPSGKGKGGELGSFSKGKMVPEFEQVAFSMKPKTVSAPVKTQFGYHLIMVDSKTPGYEAKLEEYKEKFATELIQKDKVEDIKKITADITNAVKNALESGNQKEIKTISEKFKLQYSNGTINQLDGASNGVFLTAENMNEIFGGDQTKPKIVSIDSNGTLTYLKTSPSAPALNIVNAAETEANNNSLKSTLSRKMLDSILKNLEENTKVKIYSNMLAE